jgi:hypothetical protein
MIPIINGAIGIVPKDLKKDLKAIPGKHSIDSPQTTAILGTSHIICKVSQFETWTQRWGSPLVQRNTRKKGPVA